MLHRHPRVAAALSLAALRPAAVVRALDYPIGLTNCGVRSWIDAPPARAVTLNQGTTEVMLALGLEDRMVGTAYLDDYIWPELADAYNSIPVLSDGYPTLAQIQAVEPDFLYASYGSAFRDSRFNYTDMVAAPECALVTLVNDKNESHCRQELIDHGIQTYLQKPYCELTEHRPADGATLAALYDEIWDIATVFDAYDAGRRLVDGIEGHFAAAKRVAEGGAGGDAAVPPIRVLWLDGWDPVTPFVGACCGSVNTIVEKAGAKHIFDDLGVEELKSWEKAGWDEIAARDPDLIVLVDASWDLAHQKIYELCSNETTRALRAVQNRAFIQVPFSASTLGVRIGALAGNLAEAFAALVRGEALPSLQFRPTSIADDGTATSDQALGLSGARVYERLPVWNGTDLNELCPGANADLRIRDDLPLLSIEEAAEEIEELRGEVDQARGEATTKEAKIEELEEEVERLTNMGVGMDRDGDDPDGLGATSAGNIRERAALYVVAAAVLAARL